LNQKHGRVRCNEDNGAAEARQGFDEVGERIEGV